ncbi:MAG: 30S ribosomal protein S13 [Nanoarchaeota archaeon]|nr:30S ribosomal protein S13 [Nanoarchaeota archaeon]
MAAPNEEIKFLVRILNTDLEGHKKINHALTKIKGINFMFANMVCTFAKVQKTKRAGELTEKEINAISDVIKNPLKYKAPSWMFNRQKDYETGEDKHLITIDLSFTKDNDIKRLKKIKSYRGLRHQWGLPLRGQRTRSNFRKTKRKGGSLGVKRSPQAKKAGV